MQITRQADYAVRAVLYLAKQQPEILVTTAQIAREQHILPQLAQVAELEEPRRADAMALQCARRVADLFDGRALVHRIEHALRAGLRTEPHLLYSRLLQRRDALLRHQVRARLHRERRARAQPHDLIGELADPCGREAEYVISEPDVIGADLLAQPAVLFQGRRIRSWCYAESRHFIFEWNVIVSMEEKSPSISRAIQRLDDGYSRINR